VFLFCSRFVIVEFEYVDMKDLSEDDIGKQVTVRARIDHVRPQSKFGTGSFVFGFCG